MATTSTLAKPKTSYVVALLIKETKGKELEEM
jgi:hypothetical protein